MNIKDLHNKKIAIWGLGTEGLSMLRYLMVHNISNHIILFNDVAEKPAEFAGFELFVGEEIANKLDDVEVLICSPGVSVYRPEFLDAKNKNVVVTSVTDLFLNEMRQNKPNCKIIGVSGSKGKSTSVSVLNFILSELGYKVGLGGNIGRGLIELLDDEYEFVVGEFSSYQAARLTASPNIAMFTNLFYVHGQWHNGHENYCKDKMNLIANQKDGDVYFVNEQNAQLVEYSNIFAKNREFYNNKNNFYAIGQDFYYQDKKLFSLKELKLCGTHNLENLAGVFLILKYLGVDIKKSVQILKDFEPLAHRLQKVAQKDGVLFINDSISTAPEAAIAASRSFEGNIVLISGGQDNNQDYADYATNIEENKQIKMAVTLFQTGPKIAKEIRGKVTRDDFELVEALSLEEAVDIAYKNLKDLGGGVVLFSPTSPSFGFYKNFIERGNHFIRIVESL